MSIERPGKSPLAEAEELKAAGQEYNMEDAEWRTIVGLESAIAATNHRIAGQGHSVELQNHLTSLKDQLAKTVDISMSSTQNKINELRNQGVDVTFLEKHLINLNKKLSNLQAGAEKEAA